MRGPGHYPDDSFQFVSFQSARLPRNANPMEKIRLAVALRDEWLAVGLSTESADRPAATSRSPMPLDGTRCPASASRCYAGTGGNPHTLVADPGTCRWTTGVHDPERLALGALSTAGVAYLIHPEHGGSGIAPGTYVIRRQRERSRATRRSGYFPHAANPVQYVVD